MRNRRRLLVSALLSSALVAVAVYGQQAVRTGWEDARGKKLGVSVSEPPFDQVPDKDDLAAPIDPTPSPGFARREVASGNLWERLGASPGDLEIILRGTAPADEVPPTYATLEDELNDYLKPSRGVAIVRVSGVQSVLKGSLARTNLTLHIEEVIQNTPENRLRVPMKIQAQVAGGVFTDGSKKAVVRRLDQRLPENGRQYIWGFFDSGGDVYGLEGTGIEIDGASLLYTSPPRRGGHVEVSGAANVLGQMRVRATRKGGAR